MQHTKHARDQETLSPNEKSQIGLPCQLGHCLGNHPLVAKNLGTTAADAELSTAVAYTRHAPPALQVTHQFLLALARRLVPLSSILTVVFYLKELLSHRNLHLYSGEGPKNCSRQVEKSIGETTEVTQPIKQTVSLPVPVNAISMHIDLPTCEFVQLWELVPRARGGPCLRK